MSIQQTFFLSVAALVFVACASTEKNAFNPAAGSGSGSMSGTDGASDCSQYYSSSKKDPSLFSGYGQGRLHEVAVDAARADLAKEISSEISASGSVHETEKDISVSSAVRSSVSASLVDVRIAKKCLADGTHEAVATLRRDMFLASLRKSLTAEDAKAKSYADRVRSVKGSLRPQLLVEARDFLSKSSYNETNELCSRLGGCVAAPRAGMDELRSLFDSKELAEEAAQANMFKPEFRGELAQNAQAEIISLLREKGWILDESAPVAKIVRAECSEIVFPKIAGTDNQVLELSCRVIGTVDGVKQFSHLFVGKGVATSLLDARALAKNRLTEEK